MRRLIAASVVASLQLVLLVYAASAQTAVPQARAGAEAIAPAAPQRFEKEGVAVVFSVTSQTETGKSVGLVAGADAVATFKVMNARTGQPLIGLHPNAWISSSKAAQPPSEAECKDKIRGFTGGLLSARAEIDLNSYLLLTLNHDNTISVINPQIAFSLTKLESLITLPGPGADWVLSPSKEFLYVTLPEQAGVAVINLIGRKLVTTIPTGDKGKPVRIILQPDGRYAWVGLDDSPMVAVIDIATNKLAVTVPVGNGLHNLCVTPDSRFVYVTNSSSDTVSVIDAKKLVRLTELNVGKTPIPVAYGTASGFVYVASVNGGTITVIDPAKQQIIKTVPVERGAVALRFEPKGRYGFIVNQAESTVSVLDATTNSIVGSGSVVKGPDQATFTERFAYIRGTGSEKMALIDLAEAAKGRITPIEVIAGQNPPGSLPQEIGVAAMIAPTPEGNAAMIANAPDMMIYYYVEGMMAPMGTFSNHKRHPRALLLLDRSLSEAAPGVYSTPIRLTEAGSFDVPFMLDEPRLVNCFHLDVAKSPDAEKNLAGASIAVEPLFKDKRFKPEEATPLRFKITDASTKQPLTGLDDVQVLVFMPPGVWQQRQWAKDTGNGIYEVTQTFPREGLYNVMLRVPSRGVNFADLPFTGVNVGGDGPAQEKK